MQLREDAERDLAFPAREGEPAEDLPQPAHRQAAQLGDGAVLPAHGERLRVEPGAAARRAGLVHLQPFDPGVEHVVLRAGARPFFAPVDVLQLQPGAVARRAPPVLRVVREEPRIRLGEAAAAGAAGAPGGEDLLAQGKRLAFGGGRHELVQVGQDEDRALSHLQGLAELPPQFALVRRLHPEVRHGELDAVLLEAVQARKGGHRQKRAVHAQVGVALARGPARKVRVHALAARHQRREQADPLPAVLAHQARGDGFLALRLDRHGAVRAVLHAELDEEQPQEMVHLGERADGGLRAAAAGALLDRHRRRDAEDGVHVRARRRCTNWRA